MESTMFIPGESATGPLIQPKKNLLAGSPMLTSKKLMTNMHTPKGASKNNPVIKALRSRIHRLGRIRIFCATRAFFISVENLRTDWQGSKLNSLILSFNQFKIRDGAGTRQGG